MNIYKFKAMLAEFPFLREILVCWPDGVCSNWFDSQEKREEQVKWVTSLYGDRFEFGVTWDEDESGYVYPYYIEVPDGLQIKKVDDNLLSRTPESDEYSYCEGGYKNYTYYYTVGENGDVTKLDVAKTWANGSGGRGSTTVDSINKQLLAKKLKADFIVVVDFQDTDNNGNGETSLDVVVYKMSEFDLKTYHEKQVAKVMAELNAEIEAATR